MTVQECAAAAASRLVAGGFEPAASRVDVSVLARALLGWDQARWLADGRTEAPAGFADRLERWVARRARHEPVAYITGEREFFGRPFRVTPDVLIPRPETELVVSTAVERLAGRAGDSVLVVDVGTGSGCIAVSLACELGGIRLVATDVSTDALAVARENARRLGVLDRIDFRHGPLLGGLDEAPDVIVSNPPYIREAQRATLPPDVAEYEPHQALFAGSDGLAVIRPLIDLASRRLAPGGWVILEIGAGQDHAVEDLIAASRGLAAAEVLADLEARPRVVVARRA